jgi:hypothetical protein
MFSRVKKWVVFLSLVPILSHGADSAYTALRALGSERGGQLLEKVVEVRGLSGSPQPQVWKVAVSDPQARGGIREFEVQAGRVVAERAPVSRSLGAAMNFNQLNLDSEGAFSLANQESEKTGVAFQLVDYTLKSGTGGGAPVWELRLRDGSATELSVLKIAADTGNVLEVAQGSGASKAQSGPRPSQVRNRAPEKEEPEPIRGLSSFFRRIGRFVGKCAGSVRDFVVN